MRKPADKIEEPSIYGAGKMSAIGNGYRMYYGSGDTYYGANLYLDSSLVVPTAKENHPKNIVLIAQIKY